MTRDLRLCFVGDSFVAGIGDPQFLGWAGRLAAQTQNAGLPLTGYNLGVRRQTSADILARWEGECAQRLADGTDRRVVLSFGVNDTTPLGDGTRVPAEESPANLRAMLPVAAARGWSVLVVGPPPVPDAGQNARTAALDEQFAVVCAEAGVPYVPVLPSLLASEVWMREVRAGDGAHPSAGGYEVFAGLVAPRWRAWISDGGQA
ncbi:hypothetical protein KNE206_39660 [Kitasatospora sp. NE20-6]|uniref:DUF459 domain-containing protein n=1 Tax=Kitasatospora sp. NE20-6 TaxID=2859066 RepID=UPI0034DCAF6E